VVQCIEKGNANCASGSTYNGGTGTYTPSGMDLTYAAPFHIVVSGNVVYSNMIAANNPVRCGSHTDGNGIILDTFLDETTNTIPFPYQSLIAGNVAYANGGRGIHVYRTSNVTVANNTAYGNGTDTCMNDYYVGDLSQSGGSNNVWINNIAQSILTAANPTCGGAIAGGVNGNTSFCGSRNAPLVAGKAAGFTADSGNSYSHNVFYGGHGIQMFDNDASALSCTGNKCSVNPLFVSPLVSNFALQSTSPAIGYGLLQLYLPPAPLDAGACSKVLAACP
jgi:parallel beta-helix repeat protein